jgi:hypothetical protein
MKNLKKMHVNSEMLLNNEELVTLRGGYGDCGCICFNWDHQLLGAIGGDVSALTCNVECLTYFGHGYGDWNC